MNTANYFFNDKFELSNACQIVHLVFVLGKTLWKNKKAQCLSIPNGFTIFLKFISKFLSFAKMQVHSVKAYKKEQEILTLSQTNIGSLKLKRVSRKLQIWWKCQNVLKKATTLTLPGKWNCSQQAISPFHLVFSKDVYCKHVKTLACLGNG